ncbi:MAG TPA: DUF29 family protein [Desulfobacterales bacterium]|nr:MAG: hypothetical protein DRI57_18515 [Deltaproteobacteria bacterium]HHC23968.1 DUF29 family protein [Desulfobacterales bacterium]
MEELFELRTCLEQGRYIDAMALLGEMEEMSKDDKINKIRSFLVVLLLHLIKKDAQKRTTRSWEVSIRNAVREISQINKRRKAGGHYLKKEELRETVQEAYEPALDNAALEAFEGHYSESELAEMVDEEKIRKEALQLILEGQAKTKRN